MVVAGEGHELIDVDGRRYLDGVGSIWCNLYGHRRPEVDRAVTEQLGRIAHSTFLGNASAPGVELAHRLANLAPGDLNRVFYSDSGSTAVEVAIKMALQFWQQERGGEQRQRTRFLAFGDAYHGDTVGAVSVGGIEDLQGSRCFGRARRGNGSVARMGGVYLISGGLKRWSRGE